MIRVFEAILGNKKNSVCPFFNYLRWPVAVFLTANKNNTICCKIFAYICFIYYFFAKHTFVLYTIFLQNIHLFYLQMIVKNNYNKMKKVTLNTYFIAIFNN